MSSSQLFKGIPVLDWIVRSTLGTQNQRMVKRYLKQVELVNRQEDRMRALTDPQLMAMTDEFRARITKGEKPFDLRPEIFAVAREAMDRSVGIRNIFNPALPEDQRFNPERLPVAARALYEDARARIAFYASTPGYIGAFEHLGLGDLARRASVYSREQRWEELPGMISDDVLQQFAVVGTYDEIGRKLVDRYGGLVTDVEFSIAVSDDDDRETLRKLAREIQADDARSGPIGGR